MVIELNPLSIGIAKLYETSNSDSDVVVLVEHKRQDRDRMLI